MKLTFRNGRVGAQSSASLGTYLRRMGRNLVVRDRSGTGDFTVNIPSNGYATAQLHFKRQESNEGFYSWKLITTLEINPTRYYVLRECGRPRNESRVSLDDGDNWIPDELTSRALGADWEGIVHRAVLSAIQYVENMFLPEDRVTPRQQASDDVWDQTDIYPRSLRLTSTLHRRAMTFEFNWSSWAISQIETYWEYVVEDAITTVHNIRANAQEIVAGIQVTEFPTGNPSYTHQQNAIGLSIPLGRHAINLVVYAKIIDRVRLEVRHLSNARSAYRHLPSVRDITTGHFDGLFAMLRIVTEQATVRADQMLRAIWTREIRTGGSTVRLAMFMVHIANACGGSQTLVQRVLAPLVMRGMVAKDGSPELTTALEQLQRNGVLVRVRSRLRSQILEFTCTRTYSDLLDHLRVQLPNI